jgi:hypothetical protein
MLALRNAASMQEAVNGPLHPHLKAILTMRMEQLGTDPDADLGETVHFIVVEPGDQPDHLDRELGFPFLTNLLDGTRFGEPDFTPSFEWVQDHGCWFEVVFMLTDEFGIAVFLQDDPGMHFDLHMFCLEYAGRPI